MSDKVEAIGVGSMGENSCCVKTDHLSKVLGIDIDAIKKTIDIAFEPYKFYHPSHLRRYLTNNRII